MSGSDSAHDLRGLIQIKKEIEIENKKFGHFNIVIIGVRATVSVIRLKVAKNSIVYKR